MIRARAAFFSDGSSSVFSPQSLQDHDYFFEGAVLSSREKGTLQGIINDRRVVLLLIFPLLPFLQLLLLLLLQLELSALVLRGEDRRSAQGFGRQRLFGDRSRDVPFRSCRSQQRLKIDSASFLNEGGTR